MTTSESLSNLTRMADGLMDRYEKALQPNPFVLYTDRDCCKAGDEKSKFQRLFHRWESLLVRLDSWHFMRRIAKACTNESHPLYGIFMAKLSGAIFEWDEKDVDLLREAKKFELVLAGLKNPSTDAVNKSISKVELAKLSKRQTRRTDKTIRLIEHFIRSPRDSTDTLGVPLLREDVWDIWKGEKRHIACIQDPECYQLYTKTGGLSKGGVLLPSFQCARGTTSLESFHSHLKNFIPGIT
jgi:hypothetical protein